MLVDVENGLLHEQATRIHRMEGVDTEEIPYYFDLLLGRDYIYKTEDYLSLTVPDP